jgi:hypothetical protein
MTKKNNTVTKVTNTVTIDDVREACQDMGDQLKNNYDKTGDIKVAATAVGAYNVAIKAAQLQLIYKKLTGTPANMTCLEG